MAKGLPSPLGYFHIKGTEVPKNEANWQEKEQWLFHFPVVQNIKHFSKFQVWICHKIDVPFSFTIFDFCKNLCTRGT